MFDQAGMVRELVKWDYELRVPGQIGDVVARGVEVAMAHPRGPVYLVLPREPLAASLPEPVGPTKPRPQAAAAYPDPRTIATLAEWIAAAERPLIVTSTLPAEAVHQLERLAERCAIPVVTHNPRSVCLPSSHSMHFGFEPGTLLADADLVIVLESDVPWIPHLQHPPGGCRSRAYRRGSVLRALSDAELSERPCVAGRPCAGARCACARRRAAPADGRRAHRGAPRAPDRAHADAARTIGEGFNGGTTISPEYLSRVIGETVGKDAVIINEYPLRPDHCAREKQARSSRSGLPADLDGDSAQRSEQSSQRPTTSWSRLLATAPTCSPIRWSDIGCPPFIICQS
jgi:acetolactate synthase-1/2/3 large subunit